LPSQPPARRRTHSQAAELVGEDFSTACTAANGAGGPGGFAPDLVGELGSDGVTPKKLVITSEWAGMLDLVASALEPITTAVSRLDGRMTPRARTAALKAFRQGNNNVMLMTLGVGGVGLDIPEAEVIIVLAPWWNPKRIDQAIARLTRDDRHESITAYILVMKDSLEEGVLEIGERKRAMIQTVLDGGDSDETGALTEADLALLFQSRA
jgi:SNF2 family DNA or RNA helicase